MFVAGDTLQATDTSDNGPKVAQVSPASVGDTARRWWQSFDGLSPPGSNPYSVSAAVTWREPSRCGRP